MRRLKRSEIALVTASLLKAQEYGCPLCDGSLRATAVKTPALDHDHSTGFIRGVLCVHCNGIEGKVFNLARRAKNKLTPEQWLSNLVEYWRLHSTPQHPLLHHTHLTEEEKRIARNKRAATRRAAVKKRL